MRCAIPEKPITGFFLVGNPRSSVVPELNLRHGCIVVCGVLRLTDDSHQG